MALLWLHSLLELFGFADTSTITGSLLPDHFDLTDGAFALLTFLIILKFVNSLRPLLGE